MSARARPTRGRHGQAEAHRGLVRRGRVVDEERPGDRGQLGILEALGESEVVSVYSGAPGQVQLLGTAPKGPLQEPVHPSERV
jgi:hypothetical protein